MGRVHKALVKADRWGAGPVAQPDRLDRADLVVAKDQDRAGPAPQDFKFDYGFAAPPPAPGARVEATQEALASRPAVPARVAQKPAPQEPAPQMPIAEKAIERGSPPAPVFEEPSLSMGVAELKLEARFAALTGGDAVASERYRALAIRVLNFAPSAKLKTLLVTSAQSGEGKSTVAANLAWVLARRGERRVLLIEAGAKTAGVPALFQIASFSAVNCGLMDLLNGSTRLSETLCRIDPNGLYVMTAGRQSTGDAVEVAAALASSGGERLTRELSKHFDLIVIDAPAMLESAEVERLASVADATVLVARAGHTHREVVAEAIKLIPERRRCGVVLNEAETVTGRSKPGRLFGRKVRRTGRQ